MRVIPRGLQEFLAEAGVALQDPTPRALSERKSEHSDHQENEADSGGSQWTFQATITPLPRKRIRDNGHRAVASLSVAVKTCGTPRDALFPFPCGREGWRRFFALVVAARITGQIHHEGLEEHEGDGEKDLLS
jgi:hypothetical protein